MISYIGLGSNLEQPLLQLKSALLRLRQHADIELVQVSGFYQSEALTLPGAAPQDDYVNAAAKLETFLTAEQLLEVLHDIEQQQGRERKEKWGSRTLDLDILLYGDRVMNTETLIIPHAQMKHRNFVIHPLYEVAGAIDIPGLGKLQQLAQQTDWHGLRKITEQ